jgi:hypothetical protein
MLPLNTTCWIQKTSWDQMLVTETWITTLMFQYWKCGTTTQLNGEMTFEIPFNTICMCLILVIKGNFTDSFMPTKGISCVSICLASTCFDHLLWSTCIWFKKHNAHLDLKLQMDLQCLEYNQWDWIWVAFLQLKKYYDWVVTWGKYTSLCSHL